MTLRPLTNTQQSMFGFGPNDFMFGMPSMDAGMTSMGDLSSLADLGKAPTIDGLKLGFNRPTLSLALDGLGSIGGLMAAFQQQKLAKKQFRYARDVSETNLANQIKSYNTSLEDRARSRAVVESQTPDQMQSYIDQNRLTRRPTGA